MEVVAKVEVEVFWGEGVHLASRKGTPYICNAYSGNWSARISTNLRTGNTPSLLPLLRSTAMAVVVVAALCAVAAVAARSPIV